MSEADVARGRPARFFEAHLPLLVEAARASRLLDLACGRGRHAVTAARAGLRVVALDRNQAFLDDLATVAIPAPGRIETFRFDLEAGDPAESGLETFGAVVVSRYLHWPLMPWIQSRVAPGGLLVYETFTTDQRRLGWGPTRDDFLLRPGELELAFPELETLVYEEGPSADAASAQTARLLARRSSSTSPSRLRSQANNPR